MPSGNRARVKEKKLQIGVSNPVLSSGDLGVKLSPPSCQRLHHKFVDFVIRQIIQQFSLQFSLSCELQPCPKRQTKRQVSPVKYGFCSH